MTTLIIIEEYDPQWPKSFELIHSRIAPALGNFATAIEHIGSTAVAGLPAKPIIDVDVLLKSSQDLAHVTKKLAGLGYQRRGTVGLGAEAFDAPTHDVRHHLYLCSPDGHEFSHHLAFRDFLRSHPQDANDYARLKRSLSGRFSIDGDAYNDAKADFIERILRRARLETPELFPRARRMNN